MREFQNKGNELREQEYRREILLREIGLLINELGPEIQEVDLLKIQTLPIRDLEEKANALKKLKDLHDEEVSLRKSANAFLSIHIPVEDDDK